jgi:Tol biopolymer transport system component
VALSPDGSRAAVSLNDPSVGSRDLWIYDVTRGLGERFTFDPGEDFGPNWSYPRGDRIVFSSIRNGSIQLYQKPSSGIGQEEVLLQDGMGKFNGSFSPDGRFIVYVAGGGIIGRSDLYVLPLFGDRKPFPFLDSPLTETQGQFSPDGRWLAYTSRESGRYEVFVTSFPEKATKLLVSTAGGSLPRWNRNGKELFYLAPDSSLIATPVDTRTALFHVGAPTRLFTMHPRPTVRLDAYPYDVTPDGQRFLVNTFVEDTTSIALVLIVNWRKSIADR